MSNTSSRHIHGDVAIRQIKLLYNVVLVPGLQQRESAIYIRLSPPSRASLPPHPILPLQIITEHQAEFPVLYCSFPLASYFIRDSVCYMLMIASRWWISFSSSVCLNIDCKNVETKLIVVFWKIARHLLVCFIS